MASRSERLAVATPARGQVGSWLEEYEEAMRDAFKEGQAIVHEAVERAEARRRIYVDSDGIAVIAYNDLVDAA